MFQLFSRFLGSGRVALLLFLILGCVLVTVGPGEGRVNAWISDMAAPLLYVVAVPVQRLGVLRQRFRAHMDVVRENERLRAHNERLRPWQDVALGLEARAKEYEMLLKLQPVPPVAHVSGRVVGESQGPFFRTLLVYAGRGSGVREGQPALGGRGLIGRVITAGYQASRVLLLSDLNSRVPVVVGPQRHRAVLAGDNTAQPLLEYLEPTAQVAVGQHVVTSGHGSLFPPDLPVGEVALREGDRWRVHLFSEPTAIRYVRILKTEPPHLLHEEIGG